MSPLSSWRLTRFSGNLRRPSMHMGGVAELVLDVGVDEEVAEARALLLLPFCAPSQGRGAAVSTTGSECLQTWGKAQRAHCAMNGRLRYEWKTPP